MRRVARIVSSLAFALLSCSGHRIAAAAAPPLWAGDSGGFHVTIGADRLVASDRRGKVAFALESEVVRDWQDGVPYTSYVPLALVGPYLSLERDLVQSEAGAAHPQHLRDFVTVDLREPGKPVSLTQWYSEAELLSALLADPYLQDRLKGTSEQIASLRSLSDAMNRLNDCHAGLHESSITSFAFHRRIDRNRVAVRIGLDQSCIQGEIVQLGIVLRIPDALASDLADAAGGRRGFLMNTARRIFDDSFSIGPR